MNSQHSYGGPIAVEDRTAAQRDVEGVGNDLLSPDDPPLKIECGQNG